MVKRPTLTTDSGMPVADNQNSITAGPRGPVLMQDFFLFEKLAHQNRERIPERGQHAKGSGAYGTLTITHDVTKYTKAKALQKGKTTEAFLRFALKFPDFIHTQKRHPKTNLRSNTAMWDFWSLSPESLHQVTILMSDRGLPRGFRHVNGYGSHTYSFINAKNERHWVKFHFKTQQGHRHWTNAEASQVVARDRESHQRDLFEAIERDNFPKWRFCVQIMPEKDAETYRLNP